jgi:DNA-binding response OmpR family regulator
MLVEQNLKGHRILVVEDEYFVANDAAEALQEAGAEVLGPARTEDAAMREIQDGTPDAALLDVKLGSTTSFMLAETLKNRGIPFVFITGFDQNMIPPKFQGIDRLAKPISPQKIVEALATLLEKSSKFAD